MEFAHPDDIYMTSNHMSQAATDTSYTWTQLYLDSEYVSSTSSSFPMNDVGSSVSGTSLSQDDESEEHVSIFTCTHSTRRYGCVMFTYLKICNNLAHYA